MKAKYNRDTIIAQGAELFRKRGYHHVGINDILRESGIPKGSFYNFFDSKEGFARETIAWYGDQQKIFIKMTLMQHPGTPLERLKAFYTDMIERNEIDGLNAGCLVNNMAVEVGGSNQLISDEADKQFSAWMDILAETIAEGQRIGELIQTHTAKQLATFLHTGIYGAFSIMKARHSVDPLKQWFDIAFSFIED